MTANICANTYIFYTLHTDTHKNLRSSGGGGPVADIPINPCQSANRHVNLEGLAVKVGMRAERAV